MLRQAFRLRQRSILQQVHFRSTPKTRTFQTTTRTLNDDSNAIPSHHFSASLDDKVNNMESKMGHLTGNITSMKSEITATKSEITAMKSEMAHLNTNITTQMKCFIETVSAQISVFNANMDSRLDKFENRFLFRMLFAVLSMTILGVGGTVAASYLRSYTPAIQTPAIQTPAVQTPAVQTPAVQIPAAQAPAVRQN